METIGLKKTIIAKASHLVKQIETLSENREIFKDSHRSVKPLINQNTEPEVVDIEKTEISFSEFMELNNEIANKHVEFFETNGFNNIDEIIIYYLSKLELGDIPDNSFQLNDGTEIKIEDVCPQNCQDSFVFISGDYVWTNCGCELYRVEDFYGVTLYYAGKKEALNHRKENVFYIPEKNLNMPLNLCSLKIS